MAETSHEFVGRFGCGLGFGLLFSTEVAVDQLDEGQDREAFVEIKEHFDYISMIEREGEEREKMKRGRR